MKETSVKNTQKTSLTRVLPNKKTKHTKLHHHITKDKKNQKNTPSHHQQKETFRLYEIKK